MYGMKPRLLPVQDGIVAPAVCNRNTANQRMNRILRSKSRVVKDSIKPGDYVYYWRDNVRWLGPGKVISVLDGIVTIVHDERAKTSSLNRVKKTMPPVETLDTDDEDMSTELEGAPAQPGNSEAPNAPLTPPENRSEVRKPWIAIPADIQLTTMDMSSVENSDTAALFVPNTSNFTTRGSSSRGKTITPEGKKAAYEREMNIWVVNKAMKVIDRDEAPLGANIIGSHTNYRRKTDGTIKARICPWGHLDYEKAFLRTDAPSMNMEVFRLVISIAVENQWKMGEMDVTAAFLQAKGFQRDVFVNPPK